MPSRKRGGAAINRATWFTIAAVAVVAILALTLYYLNSTPPLTEEQKAFYRHACINAYKDPIYSFTTQEQCRSAQLWTSAAQGCLAWVTSDQTNCATLTDSNKIWCVAKATKSAAACTRLPTGELEYCQAFVTRNGAACEGIPHEGYKLNCLATVQDNMGYLSSRSVEICGEELAPAAQ